MNLEQKKVLVVGLGISGLGAAKLLAGERAELVLFDGNEKLTKEEVRKRLPDDMEADIYIGKLPEEVAETVQLVVVSPSERFNTTLI